MRLKRFVNYFRFWLALDSSYHFDFVIDVIFNQGKTNQGKTIDFFRSRDYIRGSRQGRELIEVTGSQELQRALTRPAKSVDGA